MRLARPNRSSRFPQGRIGRGLSLAVAAGLALAASAAAQDIRGTVTDAASGAPLSGSSVRLLSGDRELGVATTNRQGNFLFEGVSPGSYTVVAVRFGYLEGAVPGVSPGGDALEIVLDARPFTVDPVVVTATLTEETRLDAPVSAAVISREDIEESMVATAMDHLQNVPGVDYAMKGIGTSTYSIRGPRNLTAQAMLVLSDYRYAAIPYLRVNSSGLTPYVADDVSRIEVIRGPGAVIYGPNSRRGILHIIRRSPLEGDETTVSLAGGGREYFDGSFRLARTFADSRAGLKITGRYMRGKEWPYTDSVEARLREDAIDLGADPETLLLGKREENVEYLQGEARFDALFGENTLWVSTLGMARGTGIETGSEAGAAQALDWAQWYAQTRVTRGGFFANAAFNWGDAGDSYNLRNGVPVINNSRLLAGQVQQEWLLGPTRLFAGADVQYTIPRTEESLNGRFEDDDHVFETGVYASTTTRLTPAVDLLASLRVDRHSRLDEAWFVSPRAGVVLKASPTHNFRLTYSRAFEQPPTRSMFADFSLGPLGPLPYNIQLFGLGGEGVDVLRDCGGICMRVPAAFGGNGVQPAEATSMWPVLVGILAQQGVDISGLPAPGPAQVSTAFGGLNFTTGGFDPIDAAEIVDMAPIRRVTEDVFELGYKGLVSDDLFVGADIYYIRANNVFASGAAVLTPNVFLDAATLTQYLSGFMPQDQAAALAAGMAAVPLGTVAIAQSDNPDLLVAPFGDQGGSYDYWGVDLTFDAKVLESLSVSGGYSLISRDSASLGVGNAFLLFNVPENKGHLAVEYHAPDERLNAYARARAVQGFSVNTPAYFGRTDDYAVLDLGVGYALPWMRDVRVSLDIQNVFDTRHTEMVGSPAIGRWIVARTRFSF